MAAVGLQVEPLKRKKAHGTKLEKLHKHHDEENDTNPAGPSNSTQPYNTEKLQQNGQQGATKINTGTKPGKSSGNTACQRKAGCDVAGGSSGQKDDEPYEIMDEEVPDELLEDLTEEDEYYMEEDDIEEEQVEEAKKQEKTNKQQQQQKKQGQVKGKTTSKPNADSQQQPAVTQRKQTAPTPARNKTMHYKSGSSRARNEKGAYTPPYDIGKPYSISDESDAKDIHKGEWKVLIAQVPAAATKATTTLDTTLSTASLPATTDSQQKIEEASEPARVGVLKPWHHAKPTQQAASTQAMQQSATAPAPKEKAVPAAPAVQQQAAAMSKPADQVKPADTADKVKITVSATTAVAEPPAQYAAEEKPWTDTLMEWAKAATAALSGVNNKKAKREAKLHALLWPEGSDSHKQAAPGDNPPADTRLWPEEMVMSSPKNNKPRSLM